MKKPVLSFQNRLWLIYVNHPRYVPGNIHPFLLYSGSGYSPCFPHRLTSYTDLEAMNDELTHKANTLRKEVRLLDDAIQENAIRQKQIKNYAQTRKVYDGYIRTGYSKKYLAEHEKDILIHKATKKYFDDKGMDKIPKMQELKEEHITLIKKRTGVNSQYRKAKAEKEELSIVKANIDIILKEDHQKTATQER